jgi:hypothetical protein
MSDEKKIQTRFPGLHQSMGTPESQLEVLPPVEKKEGDDQAAAAGAQQQQQQDNQQQQQQDNSGGGQQNNDTTQQQKDAAAADAAKQGGNDGNQQQQQQQDKKFNLKDLEAMPEEERNELLSTLTGGKFKSLEELTPAKVKTQAELDEEASNLRRDSLAWALENGRIKQDEYESAVILKSKSPRELALAAFGESVRAENKDITDPEIEELFKDTYHEGQKEDSLLYKQGQRAIKELAEAVRKNKIGVLDEIEPEYKQVVEAQQQFKGFKKQVKGVVDQLPKSFEFSFDHPNVDGATSNTFKMNVPVDQKVIDKVIAEMTSERSFSIRNLEANGKFDEKKLGEEFQYHLKARMFDDVLKAALTQNAKDVEKHLLVQLGNKRNEGASLNNGQQNTGGQNATTNNYEGLHQFHKTGKFKSATGQTT